MRLITFVDGAEERLGALLEGDLVVDLNRADPAIPSEIYAFIEGGAKMRARAGDAIAKADDSARKRLDSVTLLAPFPHPRSNVICVGKNYHEHAAEFSGSGFDSSSQASVPDQPIFFTKAPNTINHPGAPIPAHLDPTESVDYEGELTLVIGKAGRRIAKKDAYDHVYGYTIINDVTARTLQRRHNQWFLGKSLDGFCPMGPALVTADEIGDITQCKLQTRVNGELRQDTVVELLIFDIPTLIETLSQGMTLRPGDLIATGTPVGVGIGFNPPKFLKAGDVVEITIDRIGTLRNPVE